MKKTAGLWIDHRKAVVVVVTDKGDEIKLIISNVEKQPDVLVVYVQRLPMKNKF